MAGKVLILTGAPEAHRLDWSTADLLHTFQPSIARFTLLQPHRPPIPTQQQQQQQQPPDARDRSILDLAAWRSLPLQRTHIRTGFSQQHHLQFIAPFASSADFLTTASISSQGDDDETEERSQLLADFYEHSLALHDDMASSQLREDNSFVSDANTTTATTTTTTTTSSDQGDDTTDLPPPASDSIVKAPLGPTTRTTTAAHHLSDLEDIPPASYLLSIAPQTVTVTLIVGIISIAAPRAVTTRYATKKTLVEVLVGDETKSGFAVTFWLDGGSSSPLAGLRGQDVVLMHNVALNVFRAKVYGGSLRRGLTRVHLLYRPRLVGEDDVGGYYSLADMRKRGGHPQLDKTRRVRDWVLKFVGGGGGGGARKTRKSRKGRERELVRNWNEPPPLDSQ